MKHNISLNALSFKNIEKTKVLPLRLQQFFRQRRVTQLCERAKALSQTEIFENKPSEIVEIVSNQSVTLKPGELRLLQVKPKNDNFNFLMIKPNEIFETHPQIEVLDGSYFSTHGGYVGVHNFGSDNFIMENFLFIENC